MRSRLHRAAAVLVLLGGILAAAFVPASAQSAALVVYSGRREPLILPVIERFRQATGIQVTVRSGGIGELANLVLEERGRPRADVLISNEVSVLEVLRREGVLQPYMGAAVRAIPREFRAHDGTWIGLSLRAHVVMANRERLAEWGLPVPGSMADLAAPPWRGRVVMPVFTNEYIVAWLSALRLARGDGWTEEFFRRLRDNRPILVAGGTQVRQAVARGEAAVGIANHYYYHLQIAEGSRNLEIVYPDQGPDGMGVLVSPSGIAIVMGAPNPAAARRFVDFLASDRRAQEFYAMANFEYPILPGVPLHPDVRPLDRVKRMAVTYQQLGELRDGTLRLIREGAFR
ncbi:MAG: extracellular solute-binding protein [Armatimonadota bacterium]|nr:extracellular solute-binding protein [Armatimonadota bacterium]MDR7518418.1 extracellular solute-binding protein [Armatimonadota bacterium]MDR7549326.1 extracellular solute-binding protein [Armatimonadota bacterium]